MEALQKSKITIDGNAKRSTSVVPKTIKKNDEKNTLLGLSPKELDAMRYFRSEQFRAYEEVSISFFKDQVHLKIKKINN